MAERVVGARRSCRSRRFATAEGSGRPVRCRRAAGAQFRRRARRPQDRAVRGGARLSRRRAQSRPQAAIAAFSEGSADRLATVLRERGVADLRRVADGDALTTLPRAAVGLAILPLEQGFTTDDARHARRAGHSRRPAGAHARGAAAISTSSSPRRRPCRPAISSSMPITASAATRRWRRSMSPARRTIACACSTPATTNCLCRSRISRCCRASARRMPGCSSTAWAGSAGSRARPGSSSASATSPAN